MNKRKLGSFALCAMLFALCFPAEAQQPAKISRIGYLTANSSSAEMPRLDTFRQGLRALGHIEGQNLAIEFRHTDGKFELLPEVAAGLVDSLARPGGNITGLTNIAPVLSGKRLELLKETVPKLSRVAVLWDPQNPGSTPQWKESELAARELGLQLHSMEVSSVDKYENAFKEATKARSASLAVTLNPLANSNQKRVVDLAAKNRLPAIYARGDYVDNGGLMSYGPSFPADGRDAARLVDKILKGTKPADLPVEQPTKFELIINLKTAKALGLTIPPVVMMRVEKVIK